MGLEQDIALLISERSDARLSGGKRAAPVSAHGYQHPQEQARYCHATSEAVLPSVQQTFGTAATVPARRLRAPSTVARSPRRRARSAPHPSPRGPQASDSGRKASVPDGVFFFDFRSVIQQHAQPSTPPARESTLLLKVRAPGERFAIPAFRGKRIIATKWGPRIRKQTKNPAYRFPSGPRSRGPSCQIRRPRAAGNAYTSICNPA